MRRTMPLTLTLALALGLAQPAFAQEAGTPAAPPQPAPQTAEAPIAVTPGSMAAGSAAGMVVVLISLGVVAIALSSL